MVKMDFYSLAVIIVVIVVAGLVIWLLISSAEQPPEEQSPLKGNSISIDDKAITSILNRANLSSKPLGAYNLSAIRSDDGYRGTIRVSTWNGCVEKNELPAYSYPYYIRLNSEGGLEELSRIDLPYHLMNMCREGRGDVYANGIEDPRIFIYGDEEWIIGNVLGHPNQYHPCINTMCIFSVKDPENTFRILDVGVQLEQRQKNWSPFVHQGKLYCEYSIEPHQILEINVSTGETTPAYRTGEEKNHITSDYSLRGGAPPILITIHGKKYYLGIGHTRSTNPTNYQHMFYLFNSSPPFELISVSKSFKLEENDKIQFVTGLSYHDNMIHVSYGVNDCNNRITKYTIEQVGGLVQ